MAFVLPILESLVNGTHKASRRTDYGRPPTVLVLLPTRELAKQVRLYHSIRFSRKKNSLLSVLTLVHEFQVHTDFAFYGATFGLSACCVYGGSDYRSQEMAIRKGVDIVVGTPGRVKVVTITLLILLDLAHSLLGSILMFAAWFSCTGLC